MFTTKIKKADFKKPEKWREIAEALQLPEGRDEALVMRIPGLLPVKAGWKIDTKIPQPSEWLWADDVGGLHSYIMHTRQPRFIAELVEDDEALNPPFEYETRRGETLCNFVWLDEPPEDLTQLLGEVEEFLADYDAYMEAGND